MTKPQLQGANDADVLLQVSGCESMPEFMQKPIGAVLGNPESVVRRETDSSQREIGMTKIAKSQGSQ